MLPSKGTLLPVEPRRARRCCRRLMSRSGEGRLLREEDRLSTGRPSRSLPPSSILQTARIPVERMIRRRPGTAAAAPTPAAPAPRASTSEPRMCCHTRVAACVGAPPTQTQPLYPRAGRARYPASRQPDPWRERPAPRAPPDLFGVPMPNFFLPSVDDRDIERGFPPRGRAAGQNSPRHVLDADREEDGGPLAARGRAERRIRQLSTKQQQPALVGCHRHTVQRKLREDDAPIGTLGLPREQLPARAQTPQGCGVASRRRPPLRILTVAAADPGAMHAVKAG